MHELLHHVLQAWLAEHAITLLAAGKVAELAVELAVVEETLEV